MVIVKITCHHCKRVFNIPITDKQKAKLDEGREHIQEIFPNMDPKYREMFISGICPDCWAEIMGDEDE